MRMKLLGDPRFLVVLLSFVFFICYAWAPISLPPKFIHPCENQNYVFSDLYSQSGELSYEEPLNEIAHGVILPRDTAYFNGRVIPTRYLGFPVIVGTSGTVIHELMRFITPIAAIVGAIFLYLILRDHFGKKIATISYILLLVLPQYWFWSSYTMMENVISCTLLMIALRYFFKLSTDGRLSHYLLASMFFGMALFVRADFIFLFIPVVILLIWNRKKIKPLYSLLAIPSFMLALMPFLIWNKDLYGSFFSTGQHVRPRIGEISSELIDMPGMHPSNLWENSVHLFDLTPVLFVCGFLGLIYCLRDRFNLQYMVFFVGSTFIPAFYFLNGIVRPGLLDDSYTRYLLHGYMLMIPFVVYFIFSFRSAFVRVAIAMVLVVTSILLVLPSDRYFRDDAPFCVVANERIVEITEPEAVVFISQLHWDKAIFPERRVGLTQNLPGDDRNKTLAETMVALVEHGVPVYLHIERGRNEIVDYELVSRELLDLDYRMEFTEARSFYSIKAVSDYQDG